ncbi:MAG: PilT/PilU family type 4a pilus ATPase [Pseudomonadota bacterium]
MRKAELEHVVMQMLASCERVSDLNITVGRPFQVEADGELRPAKVSPAPGQLTPFQAEVFALNLIGGDSRLLNDLVSSGSCDLSYSLPGMARFRVNVFSQRGCYSTVMRKLESEVPTLEALNLPSVFRAIAQEKNGIVLFTGATGTGKTTSMAAILDEVNRTRPVHVITLEDPVEYIHASQKATFNQRELGMDFDTFANGLRAALRQAPKVILVGEMRDRETVEIALSAAETGHLVFSSLHTVDAGQTINRVIGMFSLEEERLIRIRLADSLRWVVCQRLLPQIGGGRNAVFEVMYNNLRVQEGILKGESEGKTFYEIEETSNPSGMRTFDQNIIMNYQEGLITEATALAYATRRAVVRRGLDQIKAARGEKTTDIEGLSLETSPLRR